jgi:hypothetical protein
MIASTKRLGACLAAVAERASYIVYHHAISPFRKGLERIPTQITLMDIAKCPLLTSKVAKNTRDLRSFGFFS